MIGHIFLKDLRRLWPFVLGLAALQCVLAVLQVKLGFFPEDQRRLSQVADLLGALASLLVFFLAVMAVQLDPLPDDRQDWLVRPIRRRDLLLAKLLFVVALVHGPMLAAHFLQGLGMGFPLGQALAAAVSWNVYQFVMLTLPALALAALTRTIGQMLGLGLAVLAGAAALIVGGAWIVYALSSEQEFGLPGRASLAGWALQVMFVAAGGTAILGLQYFRRQTMRSRVVLAVGAILVLASQLLLPEGAALAMQGWISPAPGQDFSLSFADPAKTSPAATGKPPDARGLRQAWSIGISPDGEPGEPGESADGPLYAARVPVPVILPLRVQDLPPELMLVAETVRATFTAPDGKFVETEGGENILHTTGVQDEAAPLKLNVPAEFFRAHADQPVRVELDFLLGVLKPHGSYRLPVSSADLPLAEGAR